MTSMTLMEIQEQEALSTQSILKVLITRGTVEVHTEDLVALVTNYSNQEKPLKLFYIGESLVSVSI